MSSEVQEFRLKSEISAVLGCAVPGSVNPRVHISRMKEVMSQEQGMSNDIADKRAR